MAMRTYRRRSTIPRGRQRSARRYRWAVVVGSGVVSRGTYAVVELLSPAQPTPTIADAIYQQMTMPTLIAVQGHLTVSAAVTYTAGTNQNASACFGAWGIYVDKDIASSATALPAYSAAFTSTWMTHRPFVLKTPSYLAGTANIVLNDTSLQYRRYELNLRKYKRKLDSFNDTLILSVENSIDTLTSPTPELAYEFYFRLLLLE
jgi:hypothetical protein